MGSFGSKSKITCSFDDEETRQRVAAEEKMAREQSIVNPPADEQSRMIVRQCWQRISQQVRELEASKENNPRPKEPETDTIRIFVSSTFTDFNCERDILVKQVGKGTVIF